MKKTRQSKILEIIQKYDVNTQEGLLEHLKSEGIDATQATISRDIREMRLVKAQSDGGYKYAAPDSALQKNTFQDIIINSVISVDSAMNVVVLKCHTGMAQAACAAFDSFGFPDVLGTIAGDDTIFALAKTENAALNLCKLLSTGIFITKNLNVNQ